MKLRWPRWSELRVGVPIGLPLLVLLVFVVRGCDTADVPLVQPPPGATLAAPSPSSTPADLTGVQLAAVDGTTVPSTVRATGTAHLAGSVNAPQGFLPGATVRVEHLVGGDPPPIDVVTGPDGRWDLPGIAGGRYRVRAFLAPNFAQLEPEVFFLNDGEERTLDLFVDQFSGLSITPAVAPNPPQLNRDTNLVLRVAVRTVDAAGVVRAQPVVNANVLITGANGWNVKGASNAFTNAAGDVGFVLECRSAGASQLQVTVRPTPTEPPQVFPVNVPACEDPRATTSTTAPQSGGPPTSSSAQPPN